MEATRPLLLGPYYLVKWPVNPNILAASVVANPNIFRLFMNVKFDSYVLGPISLKLNISPVYCWQFYGMLFFGQKSTYSQITAAKI